jgi:hypothetical protein
LKDKAISQGEEMCCVRHWSVHKGRKQRTDAFWELQVISGDYNCVEARLKGEKSFKSWLIRGHLMCYVLENLRSALKQCNTTPGF